MEIILSVLTLSALGLVFGLGLAYANKLFFVKINPKIEEILKVLPGANCGVCGFAGCEALAAAITGGKSRPETCIPGGHVVHLKIAEILGVEAKVKTKVVATLICNGGRRTPDRYDYQGPKDCIIANIYLGGQKACGFGCLGLGTCVKVCPFGAIKMDANGLPVVDKDRCIGCGKCVEICPKKILESRPVKGHIWIACNSTDKGAVAMKVCGHGCTGCSKCIAVCKFDAINITDNLAKIDYQKCTNCRQCVEVCPTKAIKTDYK